ncbi:M48 family metalloprotease, partial [Persicitalea sp.]|uniref:M48 family metalloprotease n=1 Tax=Persicitalea sp. TaxID=3100273 RepID=UPI00359341A4
MTQKLLLLVLMIGACAKTSAQSTDDASERVVEVCNCISNSYNKFSSEDAARKIVASLGEQMGGRDFDVRAVNCTSAAQALFCEGRQYILYNNTLLESIKKLAPWAEQFIMAHEIAHHVLEHTHPRSLFNSSVLPALVFKQKDGQQKMVVQLVKTRKDGTVVKGREVHRKNLIYAANFYHHFKEYQADAAAALVLYERHIPLPQLDSIWKQYARETHTDSLSWSPQHPSLWVRRLHTATLWQRLLAEGYDGARSGESDETRRKEIQRRSRESVDGFLSGNAKKFGPEGTVGLPLDERIFWQYVNIKHKLVVEPDVGVILNLKRRPPGLSEPDALQARWTGLNGYAGVRLTRLNWYSPIWWQTSIGYKTLNFTTYNERQNLPETIERFQWQGLYFSPQVVLTSVSGK